MNRNHFGSQPGMLCLELLDKQSASISWENGNRNRQIRATEYTPDIKNEPAAALQMYEARRRILHLPVYAVLFSIWV